MTVYCVSCIRDVMSCKVMCYVILYCMLYFVCIVVHISCFLDKYIYSNIIDAGLNANLFSVKVQASHGRSLWSYFRLVPWCSLHLHVLQSLLLGTCREVLVSWTPIKLISFDFNIFQPLFRSDKQSFFWSRRGEISTISSSNPCLKTVYIRVFCWQCHSTSWGGCSYTSVSCPAFLRIRALVQSRYEMSTQDRGPISTSHGVFNLRFRIIIVP